MLIKTGHRSSPENFLRDLAEATNWSGALLEKVQLLNSSLDVIVRVDLDKIEQRKLFGVHAPVFDHDLLQIWEMEPSRSPASPLTIIGAFIHRRNLDLSVIKSTRPWSKIFPTTLVTDREFTPTRRMALELTYADVGLVARSDSKWQLAVAPPTIEQLDRNRTVLDRWLEEVLFEKWLGLLSEPLLREHVL